MHATLEASEIEGGTESNQTWNDRGFGRVVPSRDSAVGGKLRPPRFYDGLRAESNLLLSWAKGSRGLQIQLNDFVFRTGFYPPSRVILSKPINFSRRSCTIVGVFRTSSLSRPLSREKPLTLPIDVRTRHETFQSGLHSMVVRGHNTLQPTEVPFPPA